MGLGPLLCLVPEGGEQIWGVTNFSRDPAQEQEADEDSLPGSQYLFPTLLAVDSPLYLSRPQLLEACGTVCTLRRCADREQVRRLPLCVTQSNGILIFLQTRVLQSLWVPLMA